MSQNQHRNNSSCSQDGGNCATNIMRSQQVNIIHQYQLGGVHNTMHHHSFSHSTGLIPSTCEVCGQYILPFLGAPLYCLRCRQSVHQKCLSLLTAHPQQFDPKIASCPNFHAHILPGSSLYKSGKKASMGGSSSSNASSPLTAVIQQLPLPLSANKPAASPNNAVAKAASTPLNNVPISPSVHEQMLLLRRQMIESAMKIVSLLNKQVPVVGTRYCLWRYVSRQLLSDLATAAGTIRYADFGILVGTDKSTVESDRQRMTDTEAGGYANNHQVEKEEEIEDADQQRHRKREKENQLKKDKVSQFLRVLLTSSDSHTHPDHESMSSMAFNQRVFLQMFLTCHELFLSLTFATIAETLQHARECIDTVISAMLTLCEEETVLQDEFLVHAIMETVEYELLKYQGSAMFDKIFMPIFAISQRFSPLSVTSSCVSSASSPLNEESNQTKERMLERVDIICQKISLEMTPKGKIVVIIEAMREIALSGNVDTDELILLLSQVIARQSQHHIVNWMAECIFLSSSFVSPQIVDMNGADGYAITTLQQCVQYLLSPP